MKDSRTFGIEAGGLGMLIMSVNLQRINEVLLTIGEETQGNHGG